MDIRTHSEKVNELRNIKKLCDKNLIALESLTVYQAGEAIKALASMSQIISEKIDDILLYEDKMEKIIFKTSYELTIDKLRESKVKRKKSAQKDAESCIVNDGDVL